MTGRSIAVVAFAVGVGLAAVVGPIEVGLAIVVVGIGLAYDLWLKGTAWSWLPFAVGIPLLPVFGWAGATGGLSPFFAVLVPAAVTGGAALAIANGLVDVERDRDAGVSSVVVAIGEGRARAVGIALLIGIEVAVVASAVGFGRGVPAAVVLGIIGLVPIGTALLTGPSDPVRRERAWRVEAVGLGLLAVAWIRVVAL